MNVQTAQLLIEPSAPRAAGCVTVRCSGPWVLQSIAAMEAQLDAVRQLPPTEFLLAAAEVSALDTTGAWLLHRTITALERTGCKVTLEGLRPEFRALLTLVAGAHMAQKLVAPPTLSLLNKIGQRAWFALQNLLAMLAFVGECAMVLARALAHPKSIRWRPVFHNLQTAGFDALPIVGLLSFLMGVVIAYQGADQLQRFGANIFIVDLVSLSMLRELSPLMTAIIVAGRSGSAYAAQIGTMKVTEEIDALRTIGIGPIELLVLPKMLALIIALPLLTLYADITGVLGGMIMASSKLGVSFDVFLDRIGNAVSLSSFLTGIGKAPVFAAIIALVGCFQGFQVGGSADSVGRQTTVSVVQSIFLVILADALFSVVFNWLKL
jgi:phospholipid/cholesterol/gamma-HCH transport system permease protein